ncbi:MAG TPA: glycosyltransferase, partial [Bryobacteraceae bacterium]|nr:glycosyltransferase [Bryobacteraceae bacterium]
ETLTDLGLSEREFLRPDRLDFHGRVSLLKGGIITADAVNTVSRGYAREIQTPEFGFGLDDLLRSKASVLDGIVNGVDYTEWSPENDAFTAQSYSADDLSGKQVCKADLLREFGLPSEDLERPLIGMVSRFVDQKGFDLIERILPELLTEDLSIVAIGTGEQRYEEAFRSLAATHPRKLGVRIGYDNSIAHKIEAGADIFLMPSHYEPCGLNQIYSLRYGTVPVVRATGGLDDTIDEDTGFKFREYTPEALLRTIRAALSAYRERERWTTMMMAGMSKDYSWGASAGEYISLYRRLWS